MCEVSLASQKRDIQLARARGGSAAIEDGWRDRQRFEIDWRDRRDRAGTSSQ